MLTQEILKNHLHYDPETGVFTRVYVGDRGQRRTDLLGSVAGGVRTRTGHVQISVRGKQYFAHRLAWLYMTGEWPKRTIDHINGDPDDNRFANLRDVSQKVNSQNQRRPRCDNKSTGVLGVYPNKSRFMARIGVNGKYLHLGTFDTVEQAHQAYVEAKRKYHEGCSL